MTAVLVSAATEAEWLAARRQGITASEIAVVLGLSPWSSPFELYHRKTGDLPGQPDSDAMALGRHMESWVADRFEEQRPEFLPTGDGRHLYAHPERPWQMATPDRLLWDIGGPSLDPLAVLECKVDNGDGFGDDGTDQVPVHYRCQVLWQMDVLGVTTGFLAALIWHRRQVRVYELTMDDQAEADLELMLNEANDFLYRVRCGYPPEVDWRPATSTALKRLHPSVEDRDVIIPRKLAAQYRAACAAVKGAERRRHLAENQIRQRMGSARRAVENAAIARFGVARRDVYDVPAKTIERKAFTVDKLVPVYPREAS